MASLLLSWTQVHGNGRLTLPSYEWLNKFKQFEEYFLVFHRKQAGQKFDFNRSIGVCAGLEEILEENFPNTPKEIFKLYVKVRTIIRIRAINSELKKLRFKKLNAQFLKSFVPEVEPFRPKQFHEPELVHEAINEVLDSTLQNESDWQVLCDEFNETMELDEGTEL